MFFKISNELFKNLYVIILDTLVVLDVLDINLFSSSIYALKGSFTSLRTYYQFKNENITYLLCIVVCFLCLW